MKTPAQLAEFRIGTSPRFDLVAVNPACLFEVHLVHSLLCPPLSAVLLKIRLKRANNQFRIREHGRSSRRFFFFFAGWGRGARTEKTRKTIFGFKGFFGDPPGLSRRRCKLQHSAGKSKCSHFHRILFRTQSPPPFRIHPVFPLWFLLFTKGVLYVLQAANLLLRIWKSQGQLGHGNARAERRTERWGGRDTPS